jgi:peptidoglycan/LPS O-acetylase OafA/YrhL
MLRIMTMALANDGMVRASGGFARNETVDAVRLAAAAVIVLFHAGSPGGALMPVALGIFTTVLAYLAAIAPLGDTFARVLRQRAGRILVPFAVWAAFYAGLRIADALANGQSALVAIRDWAPPNGTMGQLWYLPFAFCLSVAIFAARSRMRVAVPAPVAASLALTFAVLFSLVGWRGYLPPGLIVYVLYLPTAAFGLALACARNDAVWSQTIAASAALLAVLSYLLGWNDWPYIAMSVPIVAAALWFPVPLGVVGRISARLSFAIYLIHPFVIAVLLRITDLDLGSTEIGLLALAVSCIAGLAALRTPVIRAIV